MKTKPMYQIPDWRGDELLTEEEVIFEVIDSMSQSGDSIADCLYTMQAGETREVMGWIDVKRAK